MKLTSLRRQAFSWIREALRDSSAGDFAAPLLEMIAGCNPDTVSSIPDVDKIFVLFFLLSSPPFFIGAKG